MQEYKRERLDAETRLQAAATRAKYHDEHIAVIDAWFVQVSASWFCRDVLT